MGIVLAAWVGCALTAGEGKLEFASPARGREILTARDEFVQRMGALDRRLRLGSDREVLEREYLEFVGKSVLDWEEGEKDRFHRALDGLRPRLAELGVGLPETIQLVKTTGREEMGAWYTRGTAIVAPNGGAGEGEGLRKILAHELFHVLSRRDPVLRDKLYATIGFQKCGEVEFPRSLQSRKITNPDAPHNEHAIRVRAGGETVWVVPILYWGGQTSGRAGAESFFGNLRFQLLVVGKGQRLGRLSYDPATPVLLGLDEVTGFFEQVGRNTQYVIHPEEILADNFAILAAGDERVRSPEVLERMRAVLKRRP